MKEGALVLVVWGEIRHNPVFKSCYYYLHPGIFVISLLYAEYFAVLF